MRISLATSAAGAILLFIGIVPLWIVSEFILAVDTAPYGYLFLLVTPIGALLLIVGLIMVMAAWIRTRLR